MIGWLRRIGPHRALLYVVCGVLLVMYLVNDDMGGDPDSPRGDGRYRPVLARGDGHMLYLMARSTALDLDWTFDNDLARFGDPWNEPRTETGRKAIIHPIGPALVWTPLIWIAQLGAVTANVFGADIATHGYTLWHQRFVFLSSVLFACGAVLLGRRVARHIGLGPWASSYAGVAVLLGTSLTYYATYMPSYSHALDAFTCAAFLAYWALTIGRRDVRRWLVLGLLLGFATLVRTQELAMGIVVAVEVIAALIKSPRDPRPLVGGALVLAIASVVMIPQLVEWYVVFGKVTELPQGARYTRFEAPMVMELLFSHRNGWFSTTPLAYAGVLGLFALPRRARLVAIGLFAVVAIQVYLNSTILDWWGSAGFGQRRLCNVTLPIVVGLAALIWRAGRVVRRVPIWLPHIVLVVLFAPLIATNLMHVGRLASGRPAESELDDDCCRNVPPPLERPARRIYLAIGNPFAFPANAIFALRHGVPIHRWDQTIGSYPIAPGLAEVRGNNLYRLRGVWRVGSAGSWPFLVDGWSISLAGGRPLRYTLARSATVLVPNLMPYGQRVSVWLAPGGANRVRLRWNGERVAETELPGGWTRVSFDLPDIELHTNELTIEAELAPMPLTPGMPSLPVPVGVAVGDVELQMLAPR